jgi:glyoxylase-like metal-dependent hydrolase (beta-lactamase superfamily II)
VNRFHTLTVGAAACAAIAVAACGGSDGDEAVVDTTPPVVQSNFELQMEASRLNTGGDPLMASPWRAFYCNLSDDNNAIVLAERQKNSIRVPLTQILDDVWYIGSEYVGQYVLKDANGLVMIDAGNTAAEMQAYDLPALRSLGLGAALPLHGVLVTHGHGDHDGGAQELKNATGAPIYLGSADAAGKSYAPRTLDSSVLTPFDINVGGRTITALSTPGHTAGAFAFVIRAKDNGKDVKLFVSGGSSLQATNLPLIRAYLASMETTYALIKDQKVDTASNPHIYWDGSRELIRRIQSEGRKNPSQFIIGNEKLLRAMAIGRTCTAAWLAKQDPTVQTSVWRVSELSFLPASPTPARLAARVMNGWGPVAGKTVAFAVEGGATLCTATTAQDGTAACTPAMPPRVGTDRIVASFAGTSTAAIVDLGSAATALQEDTATSACRDLAAARATSGARRGDANYSARLDVDNDGTVNLRDIEAVARLVPVGATCGT